MTVRRVPHTGQIAADLPVSLAGKQPLKCRRWHQYRCLRLVELLDARFGGFLGSLVPPPIGSEYLVHFLGGRIGIRHGQGAHLDWRFGIALDVRLLRSQNLQVLGEDLGLIAHRGRRWWRE